MSMRRLRSSIFRAISNRLCARCNLVSCLDSFSVLRGLGHVHPVRDFVNTNRDSATVCPYRVAELVFLVLELQHRIPFAVPVVTTVTDDVLVNGSRIFIHAVPLLVFFQVFVLLLYFSVFKTTSLKILRLSFSICLNTGGT